MSEEKYRNLVENLSDIIYTVNEDNVITYVNPAIESILGYKPSEVIGRQSLKDITFDIIIKVDFIRNQLFYFIDNKNNV